MLTHKTTLLLVEDDPALRHLLSVILTNAGYEVRSAQDGFSALAALREEIPDILLSDLFMPGMSGFELLSVVRRKYPGIPVIAMSSAFSGSDVPAGVVADAYYEKATDLEALLGIVKGIHYRPDGGSPLPRNPITTLWIARKTDGSEEKHITLACPECMRTFPASCSEGALVIHETRCHFCATLISYALVQTSIPTSAESSERLIMGAAAKSQSSQLFG